MPPQRLQKILAQAGIASRRACERYILDGRVKVNGEIFSTLGSKADPGRDLIEVEGHGRLQREENVYIALHKPRLVVSTVVDPEGRATVLRVIDQSRAVGPRQFEGKLPRIFPVGRLDYDAEGLILLTNDGDLTHKLLHPRQHVPKTYMVRVRGSVAAASVEKLRRGIRLRESSGKLSPPTSTAEVQVIKEGASNTWVEMTIFEGRNHQIKRMWEAVDPRHTVSRLIRTSFAGIRLASLPNAAWRFLRPDEVTMLQRWQ